MGLNQSNLRSCSVRRATDQTITTGTPTVISFSTAIFNPNTLAEFSTNPSRITVDRDGLYYVSVSLLWAADPTGLRTIKIKKSGTANDYPLVNSMAAPASGVGMQSLAGLVYLVSGDYLEVEVTHSKGSDLAVAADTTAYLPKFSIALAHPVYDPSANAESV